MVLQKLSSYSSET